MVEVFYRGYGCWMLIESYPEIDPISQEYVASGVFTLVDHDAAAYKYTKKLDEHIIGLLPSTTHPDSEFLRLVPLNPNFKYTAEECYFRINVEEDKNNDRILRVIDSETINPLPRHSSNMDPTTTAVLSKIGKLGAEKRHNSPGGSRDKQKQIRDIWATGKYTTRGICAEEECAGLGMSYDAARKALRNTPNPDKQSS